METVTYGDYITTRGLYNLAELCTYAEINPKKLYLYQLIETYLYDIDMFNEMMEFDKSTGNEEDKASIITNKKINELGLDTIIQSLKIYIYDDNDKRAIIEFLTDL